MTPTEAEFASGMQLLQRLLANRDLESLRNELGEGALRTLLDRHEPGIRLAKAVLDLADRPAEPGLPGCRALFDAAARINGAAGVAAYSLGDETMLAAATAELVALLVELGVVASGRRVIDLGCGIGRLEVALAEKVGAVVGIDLSPEMIRLARARCEGLPNVELKLCDGADLGMFEAGAFDTVIAVDCFPYLFQAGGAELALRHVQEAARVLAAPGDLVALNMSYRGNRERDLADARAFAAACGFELRRAGTADLRSWDGVTFHFHRERA